MANLFRGLLGAARDPQFRQDIKNGLLNAAAGATQGLTTDALGAPVDLINMALSPLGLGSQNPVGGSNWLANKAVAGGLLAPPPVNNLQYNAGRMLGPIAAMGAPDAAEALGRGLLDFASHSGRINPYAGQLGAIVYHGSPHKFDAFDLSKIGTGEGAQAYGHGLYFAENPDVAKGYQTALASERGFSYGGKSGLTRAEIHELVNSEMPGYLDGVARPSAVADFVMDDMATGIASRPDGFLPRKYKPDSERARLYERLKSQIKHADPGAMYTVDLPDEAIARMLDWDKPLSEQAEAVRVAAMDLGLPGTATGKDVYNALAMQARDANLHRSNLQGTTLPGSQAAASQDLLGFGIPGIRYLDGGSRGAGQGTSNYVVFDDKLLKILKRE